MCFRSLENSNYMNMNCCKDIILKLQTFGCDNIVLTGGEVSLHPQFNEIKNNNILKNVSLNVKNNEIYGLIGPNGTGKTTLVRLLLGVYELYFLNFSNETLFSLPFTAKRFIKVQTLSIWIKINLFYSLGFFLRLFVYKENFILNAIELLFMSILYYFFCEVSYAALSMINKKWISVFVYGLSGILILLTEPISKLDILNRILVMLCFSLGLFILSNIILRKVNFEKMIKG